MHHSGVLSTDDGRSALFLPCRHPFPWILAALLIGNWRVWEWFLARLDDGSDEPWGLAALAAAVSLLIARRREIEIESWRVGVAALSLLGQIVLPPDTPALIRASIAMAGIGFALCPRRGAAPILLLLMLALPIMASLQFYLGYWLRLAVSHGSAEMIGWTGQTVVPRGTLLEWRGEVIGVDPPCSGLRMLWFGGFLYGLSAAWQRLSAGRFLVGAVLAFAILIVGNLLRAALLFYKESGLVPAPEWTHEGCGLIVFLAICGMLVRLPRWLGQERSAGEGRVKKPIPVAWLLGLQFLAAFCLIEASQESERPRAVFPEIDWPESEQGIWLEPVALPKEQAAFLENFPGAVRVYHAGESIWIYRWVTRPTRQVHPAADCYRASGWETRSQGQVTSPDGTRWSLTIAERGVREIEIHEQIRDQEGAKWTEPSQWFWEALLGPSEGPWWVVSRIQPR